ncbi:sigma-54-dependent transcriptional regulator [Urbifossiella limnaea]|uniref:DNA-binding transcriptional regulator NtrC n=1 Tax=Urbifossiella limnaea TaxID=2528023 RepID=A0A517XLG2_9BACT|nr:sigma-54 dependent transcriptional regulator [Urbifossiella limnaea]QDU18340.1 Nitrogen assimilation regulatory protein [Urbifossiella limnaea]
MPTLLVVDDEASIQHAFQRAFRDADVTLRTATTAAEAVAALEADPPDAVVLDVNLPDASGLDTFHRLRKVDARVPIILVTGHGTADLAIEAMKEGAFEYLLKPLELAELRDLIGRAVRSSRLMRVPAAMPEVEPAPATGDLLLGRCPAMQEVYKAIGRVARQDVTVLLLGESGTGKELVARAIYQHSNRAERPFLAVNCAAIPETLLESELFGHEKGAFTGADRKRIGKFEQATGGTIFLDEIGDMSPLTQAKVLRLIQEQRFERVGGTETVQTDVRLVAATNSDLEKLVEAGQFRKDLYFRLNVFTIRLPPLGERGDDVVLLVEHYLRRFGRDLGKPVAQLAPEALAALRAYQWPGNVRELQSVLKQALLRMRGSVLAADYLPPHVLGLPPTAAPAGAAFDWDAFVADRIAAGSEELYAEAVERMEREVLVRVLRHTGGNQLQAAKILGITRGSLRTKIRALGITINREVWSDDDQGEG